MTVQSTIETKLTTFFTPRFLEVVNESHNHSVPPGSESHFRVVLVTDKFSGQKPLARHRMVNQVLADELSRDIHALSLKLYTPEQWERAGGEAPPSPPCASKKL